MVCHQRLASSMARSLSPIIVVFFLLVSALGYAEVTPTRSWTTLVSSNGWGAVVVDLVPSDGNAHIHHFREHIYAAEEPQMLADGNESWSNGAPDAITSRDLLFDNLVGVRANGEQSWLKSVPVNLDASGYEEYTEGQTGGTPIIRMVQQAGDLEFTRYVFAPWGLEHASYVLLVKVKNTSASPISDISLFTLHNLHLGFGRPGPAGELGAEWETLSYDSASQTFNEVGYAGSISLQALGSVTNAGSNHQGDGATVWGAMDSNSDLPSSADLGSAQQDWGLRFSTSDRRAWSRRRSLVWYSTSALGRSF